MVKDLLIEAVSYKTRGIKAAGKWIEVPYGIDLNVFTKGKIYKLEICETFDNKLKLVEIK